MTKDKTNSIDFKDVENTKSLSLLIDIIHKFSQDIISAETEIDIFKILVNDVSKQMFFVDCVVYKVDSKNKRLKQVAAFGDSKINQGQINNPLELKFGQGHAGFVAQKGQPLLISDVTKSDNYFFDVLQAGSEMVIPVKIRNEVYAVISSEHPEKKFYKEGHQKLWEVISSIAAGALVKIHKKDELEKIKNRLESVIERKSADLDKAIETLSTQYSEMKYYHEKQETLIQECHHRVTNNLQVISSILRLYINKDPKSSSKSLQEVHNRVQVMALIHQNIYKSMEMNLVNISSYLNDLLSYLKSTSLKVNVNTNSEVEVEYFGLDVLVPVGLYITEVFYFWIEQVEKYNLKSSGFNIQLKRCKEEFSFVLLIKDDAQVPLLDTIDIHLSEEMNSILVSALIEQLEGDLEQGFDDGNYIKLRFKALS
ncbi:MAG TPA: histidine kinase dimerization/phosphoacceptor domain -containing protein [Brumimicrobium sp.]|nr:histidine kinase dimerization/phosphoacceptor domain -containing protein [Brumimicrobium sp.]